MRITFSNRLDDVEDAVKNENGSLRCARIHLGLIIDFFESNKLTLYRVKVEVETDVLGKNKEDAIKQSIENLSLEVPLSSILYQNVDTTTKEI
jgi:hypothetical protein